LKSFNIIKHKYFRRIKQLAGGRFYINPNSDLDSSILVAGTARSGTTWLGDLIASQLPCRILFEPFNPELVPEYSNFHYFQYLQSGTENAEFYALTRKILLGDIRNRWIDHKNERIVAQYRLIKAIRANLTLKWLHENFSEVPIILMLRHPCAVVLSRMELHWATDQDIEPFMVQPDLVADFLSPFVDFIENAKTDEEKHAIIWCVSNLVPLRQFKPGRLKIVYYEDLCSHPETELLSVLEYIGQPITEPTRDKINQPSQTTRRASAIMTGANKLSAWQQKLSRSQIDSILQVVSVFGLSHLYGESILPLHENAI
jgi:hypothetical protein